MFAGAFLAGKAPMSIPLSRRNQKLITIFGAGLLVGTALIVIIPEGVAMHYEAQLKHSASSSSHNSIESGHSAHEHASSHSHRFLLQETSSAVLHEFNDRPIRRVKRQTLLGTTSAGSSIEETDSESELKDVDLMQDPSKAQDEITHEHPGHWVIGASLALGFVFQLLIDRLSGGVHSHSHSHSHGHSRSSAGATAMGASDPVSLEQVKSKSAMIGLVVHAFVDGIALGSALREGDAAIGMIVFLAIMLHKAPSSFGLTSYLLHNGLSTSQVNTRLFIFSCAAPLGTIVTYAFLSLNMFTYKQEMLALCFLFSGGTFLYVSTAHILPEVQNTTDEDDDEEKSSSPTSSSNNNSFISQMNGKRFKLIEIFTLVGGILLPLFVNVHHGH
jgi:solute carrier family 39 (zinc transporter), member 9